MAMHRNKEAVMARRCERGLDGQALGERPDF